MLFSFNMPKTTYKTLEFTLMMMNEGPKEIWEKCFGYYVNRVISDINEKEETEYNTQDQYQNMAWYHYRIKRFTASQFGDIFKSQPDSRRINLAKEFIYGNPN